MRILLATLLVSLAATAAAADPKPPTDVGKMASDDCARARRAKKDCVLTIDTEEIEGGTPVPNGMTITARTGTKHPSLIRVRTDFIQEILKSAEDL